MEKMKFKKIEDETEIDRFIDKIQNFTNVRLPKSYVDGSKIVGAFLHGTLVGGYIIVTKPQFRSLSFVPDSIKNSNPFFKIDTYEMMEVNGVWIGPAIKTPKMQFHFWMKLLIDIFLAKKKYLLLMSNLKNKNIEYIHNLSNPVILYEGSPNLMAGENSHESIRVGYTTRMKSIMNFPKYWMEMKDRERRAEAFTCQRKLGRQIDFKVEFPDAEIAQ